GFVEHGLVVPPRPLVYSIGLATRSSWMLLSSHVDSSRRFLVASKSRRRKSADVPGDVRAQRSIRPRSTAFSGAGGVASLGSTGMKAGNLSRYFFAPFLSFVRL